MARAENHELFLAHGIYVRNLIAHSCNIQSVPDVTQGNNIGRPRLQYTVEDAVKMVRDSSLAAIPKIDMVE